MSSSFPLGLRHNDPERTQYHHFIPRFIVANSAVDKTSSVDKNSLSKVRSNQSGSRKKENRGDGPDRSTSDNGRPMSNQTTPWFVDMYRDLGGVKQFDIEEKFALLETQTGHTIAKVKNMYENDASLELSRLERDTLRKFLFSMKY